MKKKLENNRIVLSEVMIKKLLIHHKGWIYEKKSDSLLLEKKFKNFTECFAFMTACALVAERLNHHPEWSNVYNKLSMRLRTHDCDKPSGGVTLFDFEFLKQIKN